MVSQTSREQTADVADDDLWSQSLVWLHITTAHYHGEDLVMARRICRPRNYFTSRQFQYQLHMYTSIMMMMMMTQHTSVS